MAIEQRLIAKIGDAGGKLHTARSRNDQVALDERLYLRNAIGSIAGGLLTTQRELLRLAEKNREVIMPAYTHLQRAQPVLFAHHLLAYVSMLDRDAGRFADALRRINLSPLGAAAATGTSFPVDRPAVARALRLDGIVENSIDAVSDRDVQIEAIAACAITMMHLSRFAEELVLWSTKEWNFVAIGDAFTTGSSIMPQKKNPDVAELIRGKTGRVYGDLMALLTVMKGLPLAYNRDMQEDKEPLFDAVETLSSCLGVLTLMLPTVKIKRDRFEAELAEDDLLATEVADYLVRKGMAFRKAHAIVGRLVALSEKKKLPLARIPLEEYRRQSRAFDNDVYAVLTPRSSIARKKSAGSTSPGEVARSIQRWKNRLK
jgi:argininosuccinate lyase